MGVEEEKKYFCVFFRYDDTQSARRVLQRQRKGEKYSVFDFFRQQTTWEACDARFLVLLLLLLLFSVHCGATCGTNKEVGEKKKEEEKRGRGGEVYTRQWKMATRWYSAFCCNVIVIHYPLHFSFCWREMGSEAGRTCIVLNNRGLFSQECPTNIQQESNKRVGYERGPAALQTFKVVFTIARPHRDYAIHKAMGSARQVPLSFFLFSPYHARITDDSTRKKKTDGNLIH